jgi:hypothetical protein
MTTAAVPETTDSAPAAKLVDPITYANALKLSAAADRIAADKSAKVALQAAQDAGAQARQAVDDVRKADTDVKTAEAKIAALEAPATAPAQPAASPVKQNSSVAEAAPVDPAAVMAAAQSELTRARSALDDARAREAAHTAAAFAAVETWKGAVAAAEAAKDKVIEAERRVEPVSVLISRKEGKIFIRQDWKEVYEAPITIRDPDRPLGTHVYTAVEAAPDGSSMHWTAMSVPTTSMADDNGASRRSRGKGKAPEQPAAPPPTAETASGALDRVELPADVRDRIGELLWNGGSLIVSDYPRSGEMSEYSDFIILTR